MDTALGWAFGIAATLGGPLLFAAGFRGLRRRQLIEHTPTARIRSMAMGFVELAGAVEARSRVTAPFSGHPCAWWEVEVQTLRGGSGRQGRRGWHTVHRERSGSPFYLRDDTGVALVQPAGGEVHTAHGVEEETGGLGVPQLYMDYMERAGLPLRQLWAMAPMRFRERRLAEGQQVFVLGRAHPRPQAHVVAEPEEDLLAATGTDGWAARRLHALDREVQGVVRKAPSDPLLLISTQSEKSLSLGYGLQAFGGLVGGPLLTLFGVWCLLALRQTTP
jgi:hypothetical protein